MTPAAIIFAGVALTMVLLIHTWRTQSEGARLRLRLASIAPADDFTPNEPEGTQSIERLLLCAGKDRAEVVTALRGAGYYGPRSVLLFAVIRFVCSLVAAVACYFMMRADHPSRAAVYAIAAAAFAFLVSKMILRSRVAAHMRQVGKELPFLLDTLLLLLESGISLDQAFRYFAQSQLGGMNITRHATAAMVDDLQNGTPYALALDRWSDRLAVPGARELAALFKQSLLHGSELGPALRSFIREFSDKRLSNSRASIGRKTTQMTMVMILFMMPALMIVLAGPAVVAVKGALTSMAAK